MCWYYQNEALRNFDVLIPGPKNNEHSKTRDVLEERETETERERENKKEIYKTEL